jgi:hypothetical protein
MAQPIDLAECRQRKEEQEYQQEVYARLCRHRHLLMECLPIRNRHIDEIDQLLLDDPLLDDAMRFKIIKRAIYVLWLEYIGEADAQRKHQILLTLREHHRSLPEHVQERFLGLWWRWLDVFCEEQGTRDYVYSPSAAGRLGGSYA